MCVCQGGCPLALLTRCRAVPVPQAAPLSLGVSSLRPPDGPLQGGCCGQGPGVCLQGWGPSGPGRPSPLPWYRLAVRRCLDQSP